MDMYAERPRSLHSRVDTTSNSRKKSIAHRCNCNSEGDLADSRALMNLYREEYPQRHARGCVSNLFSRLLPIDLFAQLRTAHQF